MGTYSQADLDKKLRRMQAGACPICFFDGGVTAHSLLAWSIRVEETKVLLRADMSCPNHGVFVREVKL